jgi:ADP-ribose pyrophosphatase
MRQKFGALYSAQAVRSKSATAGFSLQKLHGCASASIWNDGLLGCHLANHSMATMAKDVEILHQERILDSFLKVEKYRLRHSAFRGGWIGPMDRELVRRPACMAVLPYDPITDKMLLIEQFRLPAHLAGMPGWQLELIAGMNDKDEDPQDLARREAMEEANCALTDLHLVYHYLVSPGLTNETLYTFIGRFDSTTWQGDVHGLDIEHEDIKSSLHDAAEIPAILESGHTGNGILILALQWMMLNREKLRQQWR